MVQNWSRVSRLNSVVSVSFVPYVKIWYFSIMWFRPDIVNPYALHPCWIDSSLKWPGMCCVGCKTILTYTPGWMCFVRWQTASSAGSSALDPSPRDVEDRQRRETAATGRGPTTVKVRERAHCCCGSVCRIWFWCFRFCLENVHDNGGVSVFITWSRIRRNA